LYCFSVISREQQWLIVRGTKVYSFVLFLMHRRSYRSERNVLEALQIFLKLSRDVIGNAFNRVKIDN